MDALPGAAALARGLLVLARSRSSGVLTVRSEDTTARIGVRDGRVVALTVEPDDGDILGRALRDMDAWDDEAARSAEAPTADEPFGLWAARVGAADPAAVSQALRKQMLRRMGRLFEVEVPELSLEAGSAELGVTALAEPPTTADLLLSALRSRMASVDLFTVRHKLGSGMLVLSALGRELVDEAALWPDEQAVVEALRSGASVDDLVRVADGSPRAQRTLYGMRLLGACAPPTSRRGGYSLLLRKKRELLRRARAQDLLELPPTASSHDATRALRKLARQLHPDRFGGDPSAAIRAASHDVMSALHVARQRVPAD